MPLEHVNAIVQETLVYVVGHVVVSMSPIVALRQAHVGYISRERQ